MYTWVCDCCLNSPHCLNIIFVGRNMSGREKAAYSAGKETFDNLSRLFANLDIREPEEFTAKMQVLAQQKRAELDQYLAAKTKPDLDHVKVSVLNSFDAKLTWNPLKPAIVPAGARISAGKSGKLLTSLPKTADVLMNCVPVNCIPSPESPEKRITTEARSSGESVSLETVF